MRPKVVTSVERHRIVRDIHQVPMTVYDLPPAGAQIRWTAKTKANLLLALEGNLITSDELLQRYNVSPEELATWKFYFQDGDPRRLRIQHSRDHLGSRS